MTVQKVQPPQPIPYPDNPILRKLYRIPILLYRLGLGPLIGKYILILSTFGRKTGKVRRTPVEYFSHQGKIFVISGFGNKPDWYKNLQAHPQAGLSIKDKRLYVNTRKPQTEAEWDGVIAYLKASPVTHLSDQNLIYKLDDPKTREGIKKWPILTFDPTEEPCPPPLKADLVWAWPVILLGASFLLLIKWLSHRKN